MFFEFQMWILGPIAADRASNLVASFHFRVNILLVNSKIHETMPHRFFQTQRVVGGILLCQKLAHTWPLKNDTNNLAVLVCKNFVLMSPYPTPDITVQLQNVEWKTEKTSLAVL